MPFSKLVAMLVSPLGTALVLGIVALVAATARRARLAMSAGAMAVLWLALWSTPAASLWLRNLVEQMHPARPIATLPATKAIVVLGGAVSPPTANRADVDLGAAADRLWHAARLYRAGKAPLVILSGGSDPEVSRISEARAMRALLVDLGVPAWAVLLEEKSRNTRQNAENCAVLLRSRGADRILLVTSALHMERARRHFVAQGLRVVPAATDYEGAPLPARWVDLFPDPGALEGSSRALKELLGLGVLWATQ